MLPVLEFSRAPWDYRGGFHGSLCQYFVYSVGRNLMDGLPLPSAAVIGHMYIVGHCVFGFVKRASNIGKQYIIS